MATFGNISAPDSWLSGGESDVFSSIFTLAESADVTSVSAWVDMPGGIGDSYASARFAVYSSNVLVAASADVFNTGIAGAQLLTIPVTATLAAGTYRLAAQLRHDSMKIGRVTDVSGAGISADAANTWAAGAPDPFVEAYTRPENEQVCIYATYTAASSPTLSTLDATAAVGGTGYSGTTANMSAITSLTNATIAGTSANAFNYNMNSFAHGVAYLNVGTPTFTASDGTLSGTLASPLATMTGYTAVTMGTMNTGPWSIGKDPAIVTGDVVHLPTAAGVLNDDGTLTDYVYGTYTMWRRDVSDGKMYTSTLTVSDLTLTGVYSTASAGDMTATGSANASITGTFSTASAGILTASVNGGAVSQDSVTRNVTRAVTSKITI